MRRRRWQKTNVCKVQSSNSCFSFDHKNPISIIGICETFYFHTNLYLFSFFSFQFNISIQDLPDVLAETKKALQVSQSDSTITNRLPLCVEISLQTVDGDRMILEVWSLNVNADISDPQTKASYTVYNRMSILLKSLLSITRVTPAYKLSRRQSPESYCIYYKIYSGEPIINLGKMTFFSEFPTNISK